jgi:hypothetical protein
MPAPSSEINPLDQLAEEFVERYRKGEHPPLSEYITRHPELANEIRDLFPGLVLMEGTRPETGEATGAFGVAVRPPASRARARGNAGPGRNCIPPGWFVHFMLPAAMPARRPNRCSSDVTPCFALANWGWVRSHCRVCYTPKEGERQAGNGNRAGPGRAFTYSSGVVRRNRICGT